MTARERIENFRNGTQQTEQTSAPTARERIANYRQQLADEAQAQERRAWRSDNAALDRSGKTRSEYDSSARRSYAARTDKLTEDEYNSSPSLQQKYGSYRNYTVGATADGKYYSRPTPGAEMERKYNTVSVYENSVRQRAQELQSANEAANSLYTKLEELSGKLAEPQQYANGGTMQWVQQEYADTLKRYREAEEKAQAAYAAYEPLWSRYKQASEDYEAYRTEQEELLSSWKSTIRTDENAISADLTAAQESMAQLKAQQKELNKRAQALTNKINNRRGGTSQLTEWSRQAQELRAQAEALDSKIAEVQSAADLLQEELGWRKYYRYADLTKNADFAEKSKYVSTATGEEPVHSAWSNTYTNTGFADVNYDVINRNKDAVGRQRVNNVSTNLSFLGLDNSERGLMTDEEIAIFNYLYAQDTANGDAEHTTAYAYIDYLTNELTYRRRQKEEEQWAGYAKESPVGSSIFSILEAPMKGVSYLGQLADYMKDGKIDQNAGYNKFSYMNSAIRSEVANAIEQSGKWGKAGSFLYQTGMSMGDFLMTTALSGGFAGGGALSEGMALAIMGTGAAADTVIEAKDRGLTDDQAFALGTIAGAAEIITEKFSIETLLEGKWEKNAIEYILKNAAVEGSEEVGSDIINFIADVLIAKDKSEWQQSIDAYKAQGMSDSEAFGHALGQQLASAGLDYLGGFLSGGTMASFGVGFGKASQYAERRAEAKNAAPGAGAADAGGIGANNSANPGAESSLRESTNVNDNPAQHTEAEQRVIEEYKNSVDPGLVEFVRESVANKGANSGRYYLNPVSERAAADIKALTGVDVSGYKTAIEQRMAEHIYAEHGPEGTTDRSMADLSDIGRIQYVLDNYDSVESGGTVSSYVTNKANGRHGQAQAVRYEKAVNGSYYVVEAVPDTKAKTAYIVTAYMSKEMKGAPHLQTVDESTSTRTAQPENAVNGAPSATTIPQPSPAVNTLENTRDGENGWGTRYNSAAEALEAGMRELAPSLWQEYSSAEYTPQRDAIVAAVMRVGQDVGRGAVSPAKALRYLERAYKGGGIEAIERIASTPGEKYAPRAGETVTLPTAEQEMAERNGGNLNGQKRTEQVSGGQERTGADAGGQETGVPLHGGDAGRGPADADGGRAEGIRTVRGGTKENRALTLKRQQAAAEQPLISSAELGIDGGTDGKTLRRLPESDWDEEITSLADWAGEKGVKDIQVVLGLLEVDSGEGSVSVFDVMNKSTGQLIIRGDALSRSISEIGTHAVAHYMADEASVRSFMQSVMSGKESAWRSTFETYRRKWSALTDGYAGFTEAEIELYVWEEIMGDAYANVNNYGTRAGTWHSQALSALDGAAAQTAAKPGGIDRSAQTSEATERKTGPPERYLYAGERAQGADLDALKRAKEMQSEGVANDIIRSETGWYAGMDGKWRFEIDDSGMEFRREGDARLMQEPGYRRLKELTDKWGESVSGGAELTAAEEAEMERLQNEYSDAVWEEKYMLTDFLKHDKLFEAYPKLRGVSLVFDSLDGGVKGYFSKRDNSIVLSDTLFGKDADTLIHEIQHVIQSTEGFSPGASPEYWARREYESGDLVTERLKEEYYTLLGSLPKAEQNKYVRYAELDMELERLMSADEGTEEYKRYERLDAEQDALYEELYPNEWFRRLLDLNRRMKDAPGEYRSMYRNTAGEIEARDAAGRRNLTAEERRERMPDLGDENTVFADGGGESYSIGKTTDGRAVAIVDNDILSGMDTFSWDNIRKEQAKKAAKEALLDFKDGIQVNGISYNVNRSSRREFTRSKSAEKLATKKPGIFADKMRAASAADDIITATTAWANDGGLKHPRRDSFVDFAHGDVLIQVGENKYDAETVVGITRDGEYVFYDVVDIEPTKFKTIEEPSTTAAGKNAVSDIQESSSANNVSQLQGNVKQKLPVSNEWHNDEVISDLARITGADRSDVDALREIARMTDDGSEAGIYTYAGLLRNPRLMQGIIDGRSKTQTGAFAKWFGNSAATNEAGEPLLLFHGAGARFTVFNTDGKPIWLSPNPSYADGYAGTTSGMERLLPGAGIYAGNEKRLIPAYASIQNPADIGSTDGAFTDGYARLGSQLGISPTELENAWRQAGSPEKMWQAVNTPEMTELLKKYGYDGIRAVENGVNTWGAFESAQVKSAVSNNGRFSAGNPDIRYSAADDEGRPQFSGELRLPGGETQSDIKYGDVDEYVAGSQRRADAARAERLRSIPKEEFTGTPALEKLGVKIENSVGMYEFIESMKANAKAARRVRRATRQTEERLGATAKEKSFANSIAAGLYGEEDIPSTMNAGKIMELADYYWAEQSVATDSLRRRRSDINQAIEEKMRELFTDDAEFKQSGMLTMNYRTPERNMLHMFGDERGKAINAALFDPVAVNEAERIRFTNRMFDEVRAFTDSSGKKSGLTKAERAIVQQVIEGKAVGEEVASMEMHAAVENVANNIRKGKDATDAAREFGLNAKERQLAVRYARWLETQEMLESGKVDKVKVENAVGKYSQLFNDFYDAINDFLVAHGYEPIGFIKGYAPHIQPEGNQNLLNKTLQALGVTTDVTQLPSSIAGLTAEFKPNKRWNPYFLQRTTDITQYDIASAFESYVEYMSDVLYHTDDIMRVRQASQYLRRAYAPEEIRSNLEWAHELKYATAEQQEEFLRGVGEIDRASILSEAEVRKRLDKYIDEQLSRIEDKTKYSGLTMYLDNYANILAGKQSMADRGLEYMGGRRALNIAGKLTRAFAQANVAGNLSSALNQSAQLPQIFAELGPRWTAAAIRDIVSGRLRRAAWAQRSDFLTGKRGVDYLVTDAGEMLTSALFMPAEFADSLVSTIAVRGRYLQEISRGKSEKEAMKAADAFGKSVMGSRAKGSKPLAFSSKTPVSRMLNMFQIEAFNSWEHMSQDLPREFREIAEEKGKSKAALALAAVIVKMLLTAFLLNRAAEETYGGTPAPFDIFGLGANFIASGNGLTTNEYLKTVIDNGWEKLTGERLFDTDAEQLGAEPFDWGSALEDTAYNVSNDIPFLRNASGLLGLGDETLPMPDIYGGVSDIASAIKDNGFISPETGQAALGLASELMPGGRQIKKTLLGTVAAVRGGDYSSFGENERLKYPLEDDWQSTVKAILFGTNATNEAGEYYASGNKPLSAKQTSLYNDLIASGADRKTAYDAIQRFREIDNNEDLTSEERGAQERELLRGLDLTDYQKLTAYRGLTRADDRADKFREIMNAGLSFNRVMDIYDEYAMLAADEAMTASEQSTEFAAWLDGQSLTAKQAQTVKEQLKFWSIIPAEASTYEKLTNAGVGAAKAREITNAIAALEPEEGKKSVSAKQKWRAAVDAGGTTEEQMNALKAVMTESHYGKLEIALSYGIEPESYVHLKEIMPDYDADGTGSLSGDELKKAIDSMGGNDLPSVGSLTREQQAVLWQLYSSAKSADNNPYNIAVGRRVLEAKNKKKEEEEKEKEG